MAPPDITIIETKLDIWLGPGGGEKSTPKRFIWDHASWI